MTQSSSCLRLVCVRYSTQALKSSPEHVPHTLTIIPVEAMKLRLIYDLVAAGVRHVEINQHLMPLHCGAHDDR